MKKPKAMVARVNRQRPQSRWAVRALLRADLCAQDLQKDIEGKIDVLSSEGVKLELSSEGIGGWAWVSRGSALAWRQIVVFRYGLNVRDDGGP